MNHTFPSAPTDNSFVADGGDPTPEEARLMQEGLDPATEAEDAEQAAARIAREAAEAKAAADAADPERLAAAAAEAKAAEDAAAARAAEDARAAEAAAAAAASVGTAPTAPAAVDFNAEREALKEKYNQGDMNALELADARDDITRRETAHMIEQNNYERELAAYNARAEQVAAANTNNWQTTAAAWESEHADFLSNPMRHADMQRALALTAQQAKEAGETLTHRQLLDRAGATAMQYSGYTAPAAANNKQAVKDALDQRRGAGGSPDRTLGDVPNAGAQPIDAGKAGFAALDALPIDGLEEAVQNMTPRQLEEYLRDSPGSNSRGRAPAEADEA